MFRIFICIKQNIFVSSFYLHKTKNLFVSSFYLHLYLNNSICFSAGKMVTKCTNVLPQSQIIASLKSLNDIPPKSSSCLAISKVLNLFARVFHSTFPEGLLYHCSALLCSFRCSEHGSLNLLLAYFKKKTT